MCTKAINFGVVTFICEIILTPEQLGVSDSITTITSLIFPVLVLGLDSAYSAFILMKIHVGINVLFFHLFF